MTMQRFKLLTLVSFLMFTFSSLVATGMVPSYAHDVGAQPAEWSSSATVLKPEIALLIVDSSSVYMENRSFLGVVGGIRMEGSEKPGNQQDVVSDPSTILEVK